MTTPQLVTPQGEEVIHRIQYYDERYRSDAGYVFRAELKSLFFFINYAEEAEEARKSDELFSSAYARLIALLISDGWEPATTDQWGRVNMMKRTKPE